MDVRLLSRGPGTGPAVITCAGVIVDRRALADAIAAAANRVPRPTRIVLVAEGHPEAPIPQEATDLPPTARVVATGRPVTDATKRLEGDEIAATLERDGLFTLTFPMAAPLDLLAAAVDAAETTTVHVGALLARAGPFTVMEPGPP
jgi:hypothetical protein